MDHDISKNKSQMKYSGKLMRHWYWCIFLTLMLLVLTAVVLYINTLAGVIVGGFTVMVYLTILGLVSIHITAERLAHARHIRTISS